jgi:hypothetical protein
VGAGARGCGAGVRAGQARGRADTGEEGMGEWMKD